jgi:hypothetical protein
MCELGDSGGSVLQHSHTFLGFISSNPLVLMENSQGNKTNQNLS